MSETRTRLRGFGWRLGLFVAFSMIAVPALAQSGTVPEPGSFGELAARLLPAVVNISTSQTVKTEAKIFFIKLKRFNFLQAKFNIHSILCSNFAKFIVGLLKICILREFPIRRVLFNRHTFIYYSSSSESYEVSILVTF